jgi:hypothetical protein
VRLVAGAFVGAVVFAWSGVAVSSSSYADPLGDANTPADISSVGVSEGVSGVVVVTVDVSNVASLPRNGSLTVWFDTDGNPGTGNSEGREAEITYGDAGALTLQLWSGAQLVPRPAAGIDAAFADGRFSLSVPRATLGLAPSFGVAVVSARRQPAANGDLVSVDVAPDSGVLVYPGSGSVVASDRIGDHESSPDLGAVDVSDGADGWVDFAISIPNADALPRAPLVGVSIDIDDDARTGDAGADVGITVLGTDVVVDRWSERARTWVPEVDPKVRVSVSGTTLVVRIHRSELGASGRFGFAVLAAGLTATDALTGIDVAPDAGRFYRYTLANRPDVRIVAAKVRTVPARPRGGATVRVSTTVKRSDTGAAARIGVVTCEVRVDGRRVPAAGGFSAGRATCVFRAPRAGRRVVGTMTVRAEGVPKTIPFSLRLR